MLVLTRSKDGKIYIGDDIVITVLKVTGQQVRLGIEAPEGYVVLRGELKDRVSRDKESDSK